MWLLIQGLVIFCVLASNITWGWAPPHSYLPALLGWLAALLLTVGLNSLSDLIRGKHRRVRGK
jgi:hypothetical protein